MTGFVKWVNDIKILIEKRISKCPATVRLFEDIRYNDTLSIEIEFSNGMVFRCDFHQEEFNRNNYHQRRKLVKIRRENVIQEMRDFCRDILQVAKSLS